MADSAGQRISLTLVALFVAALFLFLLGRIAQVFFLLFIAVLLAVYLSAATVALGVGVHLVEANVIAPLIFEERISVPPVLTILSVLTMATLLGLLVAVPLLAAILAIVRHVLLTQVYGEQDPRAVSPAVLVSTTGQQRVVVIPN